MNNLESSADQVPASQVTYLKRKTKALFDRLERLYAESDADKLSHMDSCDLRVLLDSITKLESNFDAVHTNLEESDFESISSDLPAKFESILLKFKALLQRELGSRPNQQFSSTLNTSFTNANPVLIMSNRSRLPQLELPKFSGIYTEWENFFSMFKTIIDADSELSPIEKLQHLRSCLSGAALDTIGSLEINRANYSVALDILQRRFDNKRFILQAHIRAIFGLEKADSSVGRLRQLADKVTSHIRAMDSLASREEVADCIIVQTVLQKLDKCTQAKWEERSSANELPSWAKLSTFLQERCRMLENVDQVLQDGQVGKSGKIKTLMILEFSLQGIS
ncbi:uncharacterized protein LOC122757818 [Drosophila mojavensis]|uniref:uncharacterized protein LOC116804131 n=1 Tax=Drosophila mojavensis TaxID=7230 RepID=UPI0013EE4D67|nr:uncharacterized protein LOC116804131 [Drosophila mojavensis]XP_043863569.1 uncharacterized protein LOC122756868 [Drosophila mojavensis]XP_043863773.1 uncharacterized protein LOC122756917 [Drosophila mojavensis]XP_043865086.1 uncharacterized protein LOC122757325 [Drosophila mojavensis]XP_043867143.1 uncharacterized protein LOC122757772 [Drosophila mojavensis]XP_043867299.1 uncharacterized protein LOC122757818 [Drosophila mojavensis]